jgi:Flp pilus assembly secretin CpaC
MILATPYVVRAVAQKDLSRPDDGFADAPDSSTVLLSRLNKIYGIPTGSIRHRSIAAMSASSSIERSRRESDDDISRFSAAHARCHQPRACAVRLLRPARPAPAGTSRTITASVIRSR